MDIDLNKFNREELIALNQAVIARLKAMDRIQSQLDMLSFKPGDRVLFAPQGRSELTAIVTRCNQKTVSVVTESGEQWNVAPALLTPANASDPVVRTSTPNQSLKDPN